MLARQVMLLDTVASRYSRLPSQVLEEADTFDLFVLNTALAIQNYYADKAQGKSGSPKNYSQQDLQAMLDGVNKRSAQQSEDQTS